VENEMGLAHVGACEYPCGSVRACNDRQAWVQVCSTQRRARATWWGHAARPQAQQGCTATQPAGCKLAVGGGHAGRSVCSFFCAALPDPHQASKRPKIAGARKIQVSAVTLPTG